MIRIGSSLLDCRGLESKTRFHTTCWNDLAMITQPANLDSPLLAVVPRVDSDHSMPSGDYTGPGAGESRNADVVGQVSQQAYIWTLESNPDKSNGDVSDCVHLLQPWALEDALR